MSGRRITAKAPRGEVQSITNLTDSQNQRIVGWASPFER